jgi:hypothetical protein
LVIGSTGFENIGQADTEKGRKILDVVYEWGYLGLVDLGYRFPNGSQKVSSQAGTISILSPRDPGFENYQWPQKILNDLRDSFPEKLVGKGPGKK